MYEVGGKLLNRIKSMSINILVCVREKMGESECFQFDRGVRQGYTMSLCLFNVYMDELKKGVKMRMERIRVRFLEEGRE